MEIYRLRCRIWRLTEKKKTIQFTVFEQVAIEEIGHACLRDVKMEEKSQTRIRKIIKKSQGKVTKLDYYESEDLINILAWAMFEGKSTFNCSCIVDKINQTCFDW